MVDVLRRVSQHSVAYRGTAVQLHLLLPGLITCLGQASLSLSSSTEHLQDCMERICSMPSNLSGSEQCLWFPHGVTSPTGQASLLTCDHSLC